MLVGVIVGILIFCVYWFFVENVGNGCFVGVFVSFFLSIRFFVLKIVF